MRENEFWGFFSSKPWCHYFFYPSLLMLKRAFLYAWSIIGRQKMYRLWIPGYTAPDLGPEVLLLEPNNLGGVSFSTVDIRNDLESLWKHSLLAPPPEFLIPQVLGGAKTFAFLASFQMMLMLETTLWESLLWSSVLKSRGGIGPGSPSQTEAEIQIQGWYVIL